MFVGSINQETRAIVARLAPAWRGLPVYVACSGNFTVERLLLQQGIRDLHANDVSLYSCLLGALLTHRDLPVTVQADAYRWLEPFLDTPLRRLATVLLCTEAFLYAMRDTAFHRRIWQGYQRRFAGLVDQTASKLAVALDQLAVADFFAGDCVEHIERAPLDAVALAFPPTYSNGYERLYALIDRVFAWERPRYPVFDEARFAVLAAAMRERRHWLVLRDQVEEALAPWHLATVQTTLRAKPVYVYGNAQDRYLALPQQTVEAVPASRLEGLVEPGARLRLVRLTQGQLNALRSQYLAPGIAPASADVALGVCVGEKLAGAIAFSLPRLDLGWDAYLLTDLAVRPTVYRHLAKLIVAAACTKEAQVVLEQAFNRRVAKFGTTAFTAKAVSMKYRGLMAVANRGEGKVNYEALAGRWTLAEAFAWWLGQHSQTR